MFYIISVIHLYVYMSSGDRFWYETGGFESSFTLAQLQQIRRITLARILCDNLDGIDTLQPFVFLTADNDRWDTVRLFYKCSLKQKFCLLHCISCHYLCGTTWSYNFHFFTQSEYHLLFPKWRTLLALQYFLGLCMPLF
jgi:hypothetical protein